MKKLLITAVAIILALALCLPIVYPMLTSASSVAAGAASVIGSEEKEALDALSASTKIESIWRNADMKTANIEEAPFTLKAGSAYLETGLDLDIDILKTIYFNAANKTDSDKLKVSWTTAESPDFSDDKSFVFTVAQNESSKVYDLVLNGIESFSGRLTSLKLEPLNATTGEYEVAELRILPTLKTQMYYRGTVEGPTIQSDKKTVKVNGTLDKELASAGGQICLYELGIWENGLDGKQSRLTVDASENYEFTFDLGSSVYNKFAVTYENNGARMLLGEYKFVTNPDILASQPIAFPEVPTKKGLHLETNFAIASEVGCMHANIGIQLNVTFRDDLNGFEYEYNGKTYMINLTYVAAVDNIVKTLNESGCVVTVGFILYKNGTVPEMYHPNAAMTANTIGLNTTDKVGCEYLEAALSFYVERYTRADGKYGRVVNWLMGNEVGSAYAWNDMGANYPVNLFVRDYERAVRILDMTVRRISGEGRTYICFDALWDRALSTTVTDRYDNRVILDMISAYSKASNDYNWNVAHHAYPQTLARPKFWNDKDATESVSSNYVNFKNLHILTDYLRMENNQYNGGNRRVILTEQGFNCTAESETAEKVQAAAFAYAYYICLFDDVIDSFQYYRPVDHSAEAAMAFRTGLFRNADGTKEDPGEKRLIHDVYKYIDTDRSLEYTAFALEVLGVSSWNELIPSFDASKLAVRTLIETEASVGSVSSPFKMLLLNKLDPIETNNEEQRQGWEGIYNCSGITAEDDGSTEFYLNSAPANLFRGAIRCFDEPKDLSSTPIYAAEITVSEKITSDIKVIMTAEANGDMITASAVVKPGEKTTVSYNFSDFAGIGRVTSVKLCFIGANGEELPSYFVSISKLGFFSAFSTGALIAVAAAAVAVAAAAVVTTIVLRKKKKK